MHAESFSEVANVARNVPTDGASHALAEASREARSESERDDEQQRNAHRQKLTETLRAQGLLPELALSDGTKLSPEFLNEIGSKLESKGETPKENIQTVEKGDTLWKICRDEWRAINGGKEPSPQEIKQMVKEVVKLNNLTNPDQIHPGEKIKLPARTEDKKDTQVKMPPVVGPQPGEVVPPGSVAPPQKTPPPGETAPPLEGKVGAVVLNADSGLSYLRMKFDSIDKDNNNILSRSEIDSYTKDNAKTLTEQEVEVLSKIKSREDTLNDQSDDEWFDDEDGITRQDIDVAEKRMKAIEYAQQNFSTLDGDGDKHVTADEVDSYMRINEERLSYNERDSLEFLKSDVSNLEEKHNDEFWDEDSGFSEADLAVGLDQLGASTFASDKKIQVYYPLNHEPDKANEPVKMSEFADESRRLFDEIDENRNGNLDIFELKRATESGEYTGKDAQVLAALYESQSGIWDLSDDDWLGPDIGITKADLRNLEELRQKNENEVAQVAAARAYLGKDNNFAGVDIDSNKFLSHEEISSVLQSMELTKEERLSLEFLRDHKEQIEESARDEVIFENSGISLSDLESFGDKTIAKIEDTLSSTYEAQVNGTH